MRDRQNAYKRVMCGPGGANFVVLCNYESRTLSEQRSFNSLIRCLAFEHYPSYFYGGNILTDLRHFQTQITFLNIIKMY